MEDVGKWRTTPLSGFGQWHFADDARELGEDFDLYARTHALHNLTGEEFERQVGRDFINPRPDYRWLPDIHDDWNYLTRHQQRSKYGTNNFGFYNRDRRDEFGRYFKSWDYAPTGFRRGYGFDAKKSNYKLEGNQKKLRSMGRFIRMYPNGEMR